LKSRDLQANSRFLTGFVQGRLSPAEHAGSE
jgi:hypothetical protein